MPVFAGDPPCCVDLGLDWTPPASPDIAEMLRAFIQDIEDIGHEQMICPPLLNRLQQCATRHVRGIFADHDPPPPYVEFRVSEADPHAVRMTLLWASWEDYNRAVATRPELMDLYTPPGTCVCEVTPGVIHNHGGQ